MARFVEYFEDDRCLYLVTEFVDGCTLKHFVQRAFALMQSGQLERETYDGAVRLIMYQLMRTVSCLHSVYHCCHLDITMENIMIYDADFEFVGDDSTMQIVGDIKAKLIDFGVAEIFDSPLNTPKPFDSRCVKTSSLWTHQSPEAQDDVYDAASCDMWSLGLILLHITVGTDNEFNGLHSFDVDSGHYAAHHGTLCAYLQRTGLMNLFERASLSLLLGLLQTEPSQRFSAKDAERHIWFKRLFEASSEQRKRTTNRWLDTKSRAVFPYYHM